MVKGNVNGSGRCESVPRKGVGRAMIPARYADILFSFILSGLMSCIVSAIATLMSSGPAQGFLGLWLTSWLSGWAVAFPTVMVVAPLARRLVALLVRDSE